MRIVAPVSFLGINTCDVAAGFLFFAAGLAGAAAAAFREGAGVRADTRRVRATDAAEEEAAFCFEVRWTLGAKISALTGCRFPILALPFTA